MAKKNIKNLAPGLACGFGTERTLHRQFRRLESRSPLAWRKDRRAKPSLFD